MRGLFAGLLFTAGLLLFFYAFYSFGEDGPGVGILLGIGGVAMAAVGLQLSQKKARPNEPTSGEDLVAKEHNRRVAQDLASGGGMVGIMARQWLSAYDEDPSVPIFGVRPYWSPTGPGGTPQAISMLGLRGVSDRLEYVRQAGVDDPLLQIVADDPNPRVREAARARLRH